MRLTFTGTRGEIDLRTPLHRRHASLLVEYRGARVLIDCGLDWLGNWEALHPGAIVITHSHPDHVLGLGAGAACPVYATRDTWLGMRKFPISDRRLVALRRATMIQGIRFEAFRVEHSLRAPAVGYRITAGRASVFYAPDLVFIHERRRALQEVRLYIGDGATIVRPLVRKRGRRLIGHASVRTQLAWCRSEHVPEMIVTHCGTGIVGSQPQAVDAQVAAMATDLGVRVTIAHDGLVRVLR